jgi:hypothetical protein
VFRWDLSVAAGCPPPGDELPSGGPPKRTRRRASVRLEITTDLV